VLNAAHKTECERNDQQEETGIQPIKLPNEYFVQYRGRLKQTEEFCFLFERMNVVIKLNLPVADVKK
jgi:hypothetical protein